MRRGLFIARTLACATFCAALGTLLVFSFTEAGAQNAPSPVQHSQGPQVVPPIYNPYPPGILPSDINSEIARVLREVDFIETEAIAQWHAIPPPTLAGNPPILQNTGVASVEILGKLMNFDKNISPFKNEACASCHMPYAGFSGPIPSVNLTMIAYPGSAHFRAGKRTAQRYTYSSYFPPLQYNATQGAFFGGNFWDSRATGYLVRSPDANQAQFPPSIPTKWAYRTLLASRSGFHRRSTDLSLRRYGGRARSRSLSQPTLSRYATHLTGRRSSAEAPRQLR